MLARYPHYMSRTIIYSQPVVAITEGMGRMIFSSGFQNILASDSFHKPICSPICSVFHASVSVGRLV